MNCYSCLSIKSHPEKDWNSIIFRTKEEGGVSFSCCHCDSICLQLQLATWIHTVPESSVKMSNDLVYCVLIGHVFSVCTFYPIQWFCNSRSIDMAYAYAKATMALQWRYNVFVIWKWKLNPMHCILNECICLC